MRTAEQTANLKLVRDIIIEKIADPEFGRYLFSRDIDIFGGENDGTLQQRLDLVNKILGEDA